MSVEALIDQLEATIRRPRELPIVGGVRLEREELYDLVDQLRAARARHDRPLDEGHVVVGAAGILAPLDELDGVIHNAPPIPLTDQVRVDREQLLAIVGRLREGAGREEIVPLPEPPPYDPAPALAVVEKLERLVGEAREVPLTSHVRLDGEVAFDLIMELHVLLGQLDRSADEPTRARLLKALEALEELDDRLYDAPKVPLTDQVRVDRGKISEILRRISAAFSQGTLTALTN